MQRKIFRKRSRFVDQDEDKTNSASDDEKERRNKERRTGIPAMPIFQSPGAIPKLTDKHEADGEKEELVLQDTFARETAVMVEEPNIRCWRLAVGKGYLRLGHS
ncbi:hypothetical protein RJ641_015650 [Dillenia turbinata]|uniref:Uncharacterized protein n=1 Tax=Dillenia turbinata TaxID=194707 RepID=A0AAN8UXA2_9MAGN